MRDHASERHDLQLLPGEAPDCPDPDDMRHWMIVYRDLITMVEAANAGPRDEPERPGPGPTRHECCLQRLTRRLDFWMRRLEEYGEKHPLRRST